MACSPPHYLPSPCHSCQYERQYPKYGYLSTQQDGIGDSATLPLAEWRQPRLRHPSLHRLPDHAQQESDRQDRRRACQQAADNVRLATHAKSLYAVSQSLENTPSGS